MDTEKLQIGDIVKWRDADQCRVGIVCDIDGMYASTKIIEFMFDPYLPRIMSCCDCRKITLAEAQTFLMRKQFDPTQSVETKSGHKVRILDIDFKSCTGRSIIAVVMYEDKDTEELHYYYSNGRLDLDFEASLDLVNS